MLRSDFARDTLLPDQMTLFSVIYNTEAAKHLHKYAISEGRMIIPFKSSIPMRSADTGLKKENTLFPEKSLIMENLLNAFSNF
jgi:hypothetical protein